MNKFKFILMASIAAILTLSCSFLDDDSKDNSSNSSGNKSSSSKDRPNGGDSSDSNNGSNSSGGTTETYTLEKHEDLIYFRYKGGVSYESCEAGGDLVEYPYERLVFYSIDNNILNWTWTFSYDDDLIVGDTLNFKGTSNNLTGTWTRTKNKNASCELNDEFDFPFIDCKEGYDITKAVFTNDKVTITRDECRTDDAVNGAVDYRGWKTKVVNCNTIEYSKGSNKVTKKFTKNGEEMSYNGSEPCKQPDKPTKQAACAAAYAKYVAEGGDVDEWDSYYYYQNIGDPYYSCLENTLPDDWWGYDEGGYCDYNPDDLDCWGEGSLRKIAAKPAAKALKAKAKTTKFKPLLKKKK